jgi:hypothetical protein
MSISPEFSNVQPTSPIFPLQYFLYAIQVKQKLESSTKIAKCALDEVGIALATTQSDNKSHS